MVVRATYRNYLYFVYTKYRATGEPIGDAPVFDYGPVQTQDIATYCEVTG
jgi:hypothetical protein